MSYKQLNFAGRYYIAIELKIKMSHKQSDALKAQSLAKSTEIHQSKKLNYFLPT